MLSRTPPLGFNTWNTFAADISDQVIREMADVMVEKGLRDAGYEYLVIDDCWSKRKRDPETGKIVPDPVKFPDGMKAVSDYVHSKGLKFGMYSCAGTRTCADFPGSFDHEFLDAKTFAEYGADFLKYDFCYKPKAAYGPELYRRMAMALRSCGREILFSACNWGCDNVETWIRSTGAHMYRSTGDIVDNFESFRDIFLSQVEKINYSAVSCFNDMDMLTVGMNGMGNVGRTNYCTETEYKTEFALWCMFSCPLMLGCDLRKLDGDMLALVKNKGLLRIDQDEEGRPPFFVRDSEKRFALCKVLSGNQLAVAFVNLEDHDSSSQLYFSDIGLPAASKTGLRMENVITGEVLHESEFMQRQLAAHDCEVYICDFEQL